MRLVDEKQTDRMDVTTRATVSAKIGDAPDVGSEMFRGQFESRLLPSRRVNEWRVRAADS